MEQNAEVMPRPLNLSIVIYSLAVRTIFSLFVLRKHMLGFAQFISVCRMGGSGLVIRLAHAQCSVITEDGEQGLSKTGPIF